MFTMNPNTLKHILNPNNGIKVLSYKEQQQYVGALNQICRNYNVGFSFSIGDFASFLSISNNKKIWHIEEPGRIKVKQWLFQYFPDLTASGSLCLYRFLPDFVFESLFEVDILRMSSMAKNRKKNGPGEYEDFFKIIGLQYDQQEIDDVAASTYLMCFISDWKKKYMWEKYVDSYKGFCIEVELNAKQQSNDFWGVRKVSYQSPNSYAFMSDLIATFKSQYQIELVLPWSRFAYIYKGPKFKDELETRIYITETCAKEAYESFLGQKYPKKSEIDEDGDTMYYIDIPLDNDLFKIDVKKVYIGSELGNERKDHMKQILTSLGLSWEEISSSDSRLI